MDLSHMNAPPVPANIELTLTQQRIWFLHNLNASTGNFTVFAQARADAPPDPAHLLASLNALLQRYPTLRLTMPNVEGMPQARVVPMHAQVLFRTQRITPQTRQQQIANIISAPFDLERGPLLRVVLLESEQEPPELLFVAHQLILDRHALSLFVQALAQEYTATAVPFPLHDSTLAPDPASMTDAHLPWWREHLAAVPMLEMPIDFLRPPILSAGRAHLRFEFAQASAADLQAFARQHAASMEELLAAVFAVLLYRYTSAEDLILGLTVRSPLLQEAQAVLGPLDDLIPLRLSLSATAPFAAILAQIKEVAAQARQHYTPYAALLAALDVHRDLSRAPLAQVAFSFTPSHPQHLPLGQQHLHFDPPMLTADLLDLHLACWEAEGRLCGCLEYDPVIFEPETAQRLAEHFQILLANALAMAHDSIISLPVMSPLEQETVLRAWNHTRAPFPEDACLHSLIEAQVARSPERIAACCGDLRITFAELNQRANQLAHYLQSLGIQPDELVGIHLERSIEMLVAVLGVMKSGAAYVPLDPNFPPDRLKLIAEDARIKALITHSAIMDHAPPHDGHQICIDTDHERLAGFSSANPTSAVGARNLLYVIFTSGSTGRPKGVQLEHRSVVNFLLSMQHEPGLSADDVLLAVTTLSFDIAVLELYLPLITGAQIVIASYNDTLDGRRLLELIARHSVTLLQATPATWRLMLEAGWQGTSGLKALCGGEALPVELAQQILPRCAALWNMYGPTETTVWSTVHHITRIQDFVSIGHPIRNTSIYILDAADQPTPIGVPGELTIGGDGLARGYFERPELTAQKFVPDPFADQPGARMYRTGDIARYRSDGSLQFYGRSDHQVKIRGFRIELGEIETVLARHPAVQQTVVMVREDASDDKKLVAYLIPEQDAPPDPNELRSFLREHLPQYMIPSSFVALREWPLTPNGKINRLALPQPASGPSAANGAIAAPRNEIESKLVAFWQDALRLPAVSITDNFFDLGGHSLLAIRIFSRIEKELGKSLPLATLFRAPTIAQFAELLAQDTPVHLSEHHPAVVPIQPEGSMTPFFCIGGGVINLNNIARQLGKDQPFYALQWQGLTDEEMLNAALPQIAATFIQAIKTVQPHGPYYLGGSFTAGMVVVEVARQLEAAGEQVALLAGFDTIVDRDIALAVDPDADRLNVRRQRSFFAKVLGVITKGPAEILKHAANPIYREKLQLRAFHYAVKLHRHLKRPLPIWLRTGMAEEYFILQVTKKHEPNEKYAGDFDLFLTPHYYQKYGLLEKYGWSKWVAGEVRAHPTPGDPCTIMLDPNVEHLALKFRTRLSDLSMRN